MLVKRISDTEIVALFKKMDECPNSQKAICAQLVKQLSYIPCSLVAKYKKFKNYQDLKQVAYETFIKAIWTFDYQQSNNFKGWAWWWVRKEVAKEALKEKKYIESYATIDFKEFETSRSYVPEDELIQLEDFIIIERALATLDSKTKLIVQKTFGLQENKRTSLRNLAVEFNMSHENVRKIRNSGIKRLFIQYSKKQEPTNIFKYIYERQQAI